MRDLFESSTINGMTLSNRFVRSATWEGMAAEDGTVTPKLIDTMVALSKGGLGLIITGHAFVRPEGRAHPRQLGVYADEFIKGLREMVDAVHDSGGKIVIQISHAGRFAAKRLMGCPPMVVSNYEGLAQWPVHEMTKEDIQDLPVAFADGASRAKAAGFDGVQIHSAHGYLLSQFLSPLFNRRQDEYGGDIRNRSRIHLEIYQAIRRAVGQDFPVFIKMNCRDFVEDGLDLEDSLQVGRMLAEAGLDALELSGGLLTGGRLAPSRPGLRPEQKEAYFLEDARAFQQEINIPLILVGGFRSFDVAERLIQDETADYISLCRPLIREPALIKRWQSGDRRKSGCISDNLCFKQGFKSQGVYCVTKEREKKKQPR